MLGYSNGFTEGCNNGIKTMKRIDFVFRNFNHFRVRILLSANPTYPNIQVVLSRIIYTFQSKNSDTLDLFLNKQLVRFFQEDKMAVMRGGHI